MSNSSYEISKNRPLLFSTLWIVVMMNMIFADILSFMIPGGLSEVLTGVVDGIQMSSQLMLIAAFMLEIPIIMILLSRVLKHRSNRIANIVASVITIVFVIGGGSTEPHYIFLAGVEVVCMLAIIYYAWTWREA